MKVMILNTWYYPNMMGGAEHSVKILAENLIKKSIEVSVVTVDSPKEQTIHEVINGVNVYRLNSKKYKLFEAYQKKYSGLALYKNKFYELFNSSIKSNFTNILDTVKPDLVHVNCFSGLSFKAIRYVHSHNIPIIYTLRNYFMLNPTNKALPSFLTKIYIKIVKKYASYASAVTAPSLFTLKKHFDNGLFTNKIVKKCIPNCIDIPYNETLEEINIHKNRNNRITNFIYVGWISEDKGIRHLLKAFNKLHTDDTLTLCGDGDLREVVKEAEKRNKNIHFLGKLNTNDLYEQYKKADVSIVPSIWDEPFGRVVIEANAFGLPVIASNKGGIPEIIKEIDGGVTYQAGNVNELVSNMKKLSINKNRLFYLENIKNNILKYSATNQADQFISLYKNLKVNK